MTATILLFLVFGAGFGWVSFQHRHLFSEGPGQRPTQAGSTGERLVWAMVCSGLWPLMALTGLYSLWRLRRAPARPPRSPGR